MVVYYGMSSTILSYKLWIWDKTVIIQQNNDKNDKIENYKMKKNTVRRGTAYPLLKDSKK